MQMCGRPDQPAAHLPLLPAGKIRGNRQTDRMPENIGKIRENMTAEKYRENVDREEEMW